VLFAGLVSAWCAWLIGRSPLPDDAVAPAAMPLRRTGHELH